MKKKMPVVLTLTVFLIGVSLLLYPTVSDYWNSFHQSRAIAGYSQAVDQMDEEDRKIFWQEAEEYNRELYRKTNRFVLSEEEIEEYNRMLNVAGNGVMGYIEIPSIAVSLPFYHGTDEGVLQVAIGHIEGSSLPVGGGGTHCVLSGHRGLPSAKLFTSLDELEMGDIFRLKVVGQTLTYEVDHIVTVEPDDISALEIEEGKDYCTLVTCTPYGVNTHRLLVRGRRIPNPEGEEAGAGSVQRKPDWERVIVLSVITAILLAIWILSAVHLMRKRKNKNFGKKQNDMRKRRR